MRHEKKILTTFSIEPSFKAELTDMFDDMGLGWAAGVRFALKEFQKNQEKRRDSEAREAENRRHIHRYTASVSWWISSAPMAATHARCR